jgi:hypothetical protein
VSQTAHQIAGNQRRTLRKMRSQLQAMAEAWEDLDQFLVNELSDLADKVEAMHVALQPDQADAEAGKSAPY